MPHVIILSLRPDARLQQPFQRDREPPIRGIHPIEDGREFGQVEVGEQAVTAYRVPLSPRRVAHRPLPGPHVRALLHGVVCSWGT
jgi:hypothetical protein